MPRYALKIEYHGAGYHGWQAQDDVASVQGTVEAAVTALTREDARVQGAGRTDTGVHALGQVAHLDLIQGWDPFRLSEGLNHFLKRSGVAVLAAAEVSGGFHARFDAIERGYLYRMSERRAPLTHDESLVWRVGKALDVAAMAEGARQLLGRHDFTTFRSTMCQAQSPVKTLDVADVRRVGAEIHATFRAKSFLHNQIRSFIGSLVEVGRGKWAPDDIGRILTLHDRSACGPVSPPDGLYLTDVVYPVDPFAKGHSADAE